MQGVPLTIMRVVKKIYDQRSRVHRRKFGDVFHHAVGISLPIFGCYSSGVLANCLWQARGRPIRLASDHEAEEDLGGSQATPSQDRALANSA